MAKEKKSELAPSSRSFDDMERIFGGMIPRGWMRPFHWDLPGWSEIASNLEGRIPRVDVMDQDDALVIRAELPGVSKDDIDVTLSDNLLTISTTTHKETESDKDKEGRYQRREIYQGSFARSLSLPVGVDADKVKSSFKDGILELRFPKVERARRRSIEIGG